MASSLGVLAAGVAALPLLASYAQVMAWAAAMGIGGGMVTVVANGTKQILSLKIDPEVVSKDDVEMLQDLILAALNDAARKVDDAMQKNVGGMLGGKIPGF